MRYLLKFKFPTEHGNTLLRDPKFGQKMQQLLSDMKAETAYFCPVDSLRGGYIVVNIEDASQIAGLAEPLFLWLKADVEFIPVMLAEDLGRAGPSIAAAMQKLGRTDLFAAASGAA
jgi:hypothetical protein